MTIKREVVTNQIFNLIAKKSTFQKKKINSFHKHLNKKDFNEIEFYLNYIKFLFINKLSLKNGKFYHEMLHMFNCHQVFEIW